jgi:hypothetical protein
MLRCLVRLVAGLSLTLSAGAGASPAHAVAVELELVLAVDTSASVSEGEFVLQMQGIAQAFRNPVVVEAIKAGGDNGIAVTLVMWSSSHQQRQEVGWTHVADAASAERFAAAVAAAPRRFSGDTAIGDALRFAAGTMDANGFEGRRLAIDVSCDGRNNSALAPRRARDRHVGRGITVNGLAIEAEDRELSAYFEAEVIGGTGAFVVAARDFADFARAMLAKLLRELASPLSLLGPFPAPREAVPGGCPAISVSERSATPYFGARIMTICRPSSFGSASTLASSPVSSLTRTRSCMPSS